MTMTYSEAKASLASCKTSQEREAIIRQLLNAEDTHTHTAKLAYEQSPALSYEQLSKIHGVTI